MYRAFGHYWTLDSFYSYVYGYLMLKPVDPVSVSICIQPKLLHSFGRCPWGLNWTGGKEPVSELLKTAVLRLSLKIHQEMQLNRREQQQQIVKPKYIFALQIKCFLGFFSPRKTRIYNFFLTFFFFVQTRKRFLKGNWCVETPAIASVCIMYICCAILGHRPPLCGTCL